ncbi:MAG TPA: SEC-C metal-binding domain-containing protein [Thermoanaerobaculia bacterium]|nr:SEC-C metal-binding domain-containing protein [Thermoanaerobaculia bacterium]
MSQAKVGRNDPCPCGSGKKFKHCCLGAEDRAPDPDAELAGARAIALEWLGSRHRQAVETATRHGFLESVGDSELDLLDDLDPEAGEIFRDHLGDWLLADAVLAVKGRETRAVDLVLGPGGPNLQPQEREWLLALAGTPISVYEVVEVGRGSEVVLRNAVETTAAPVPVASALSGLVERWDVLAARLVSSGEAHLLSAAPVPIDRLELSDLRRLAREDPAGFSGELIAILLDELLATEEEEDEGEGEEGGEPLAEEPRDLRELAEIQADVEAYYLAWVDAPYAPFDGRSPRAALADPATRDDVLDFLKEAENRELYAAAEDDRDPADFRFLWQALGLDPAA